MIEIKELTKVFTLNRKMMREMKTKSNKKVAVDHLSLKAEKGEIYGLLGPNGAGKTTTLRCISTIIKPTSGEIYVAGHEVQKESEAVRNSIGFLTSDIKLDPQFSPDYMFDFLKPTSGEIYVAGHEVQKESEAVRNSIGFLTSDIKLDPQFSPDYMFDFFGKLHNVPKDLLKRRKEELFSYFGGNSIMFQKIF